MTDAGGGFGSLDFLQELSGGQDERFIELSRSLTNNLYVLLRSAAMHDLENDALIRPTETMKSLVSEFMDTYGDQLHLSLIDGNFFINGRLIRLDFSSYENTRYLRRIFEFVEINEFSIMEPLETPHIKRFLRAFAEVLQERKGKLSDFPLLPIRVRMRGLSEVDELRLSEDPRHHVLEVYATGLLMLRQFVNDLRKGRAPRHAKVKRLCLQLIDLDERYDNLLVVLIHLEAYKGNLFCHMLNTGVMSIVFGRRMGLSRNKLVDLGMAAFHHDLGWALLGALDGHLEDENAALSMSGINYARNQSSAEMDEIRVQVARALVRLGGFNELVLNRLIVAYECQIPENAPPAGLYYGDIDASFMTHVVRMASTYDELTTRRGSHRALRPDQAMGRILDDGGNTYEEFLAKIFANAIGLYPVGTMVELDSGDLGMVINLPSDPIHFNRPQVKLIVDQTGRRLEDGAVLDLAETGRGGGFVRSVERTLDCREYGVSITRFFFD